MTNPIVLLIFTVAAGYLIGSFPTPYLIVRAVAGIDLRDHSTGNVGVMNSGSVLGRRGFIAVLAVEFAKGMLAALIGGWLAGPQGAWLAMIGAVIGANWSVWLGWKGGRGNTTFGGGVLVAAPGLIVLVVVVWLVARVTLRSAFRATRLNLYTMPFQIALWSWTHQPRELFAFYVITGLIPTGVFLVRHRKDTDDHMAYRAEGHAGE